MYRLEEDLKKLKKENRQKEEKIQKEIDCAIVEESSWDGEISLLIKKKGKEKQKLINIFLYFLFSEILRNTLSK